MNPVLQTKVQQDLVLASQSPRRAEILRMLGFDFEVLAPPVTEDGVDSRQPAALVVQLALRKARAVADRKDQGLVIGADTIVSVGEDVFNKPGSQAEALQMLERLRHGWHAVYTGLALVDAASGRDAYVADKTDVLFRDCDDEFLERYVATGECMDKAGAYAIQGHGALLVREIRGCFYNVMGFPVGRFVDLLMGFGSGAVEDAG